MDEIPQQQPQQKKRTLAMATATVQCEAPTTPPIKTITLVMSEEEARAVRIALGRIGGTSPARDCTGRVWRALDPLVPNDADIRCTGNLTFNPICE